MGGAKACARRSSSSKPSRKQIALRCARKSPPAPAVKHDEDEDEDKLPDPHDPFWDTPAGRVLARSLRLPGHMCRGRSGFGGTNSRPASEIKKKKKVTRHPPSRSSRAPEDDTVYAITHYEPHLVGFEWVVNAWHILGPGDTAGREERWHDTCEIRNTDNGHWVRNISRWKLTPLESTSDMLLQRVEQLRLQAEEKARAEKQRLDGPSLSFMRCCGVI